MLNYLAMKNHLKLIYIAPILLALLMVGCSSSTDATGSNQNAPQTANTNTAPPVAQTAPPTNPPPSITPTPVPAPPQLTPPATATAQNANKAAANPPTAQAANKPVAGAAGTPKLTVLTTEKALDFGKQPQDKSLVRGIQIKNAGTAELKIETVAPG